jgi:dCTP deaminase
MILTGSQIIKELESGNININPFSRDNINPNSYNYSLGSTIKVFDKIKNGKAIFKTFKIQSGGFILKKGVMYLGHTKEILGSSKYAMSLVGRSSMGRYGLFVQASANLGHTTSNHKWTLELVAAQPIRLYSGMIIGQISFWKNFGEVEHYTGRYGKFSYPKESLLLS